MINVSRGNWTKREQSGEEREVKEIIAENTQCLPIRMIFFFFLPREKKAKEIVEEKVTGELPEMRRMNWNTFSGDCSSPSPDISQLRDF